MSYVILIIFNIVVLIFAYFKFISAIKNKSEKSIEKYKKEVAKTVDLFNKEFDRNLTLLEDRSNKLQKLVDDADKYVNILLHLDKEMDVDKVNKLVVEVKEELNHLEKDQKILKESIIKQRLHLDNKIEKKLLKSDLDNNMSKQIETKQIKEISKKANDKKSLTYSNIEKKDITEEKPDEEFNYEEILQKSEDFEILINNSKKSDNEIKKPNHSFVQKAYLSELNKKKSSEDETKINSLLEKNLANDKVDIKGKESISKEKIEDSFKETLEKSIAKKYIYNDTSEKESLNIKKKSSGISEIQSNVFSLLDEGKSVEEICAELDISKGAAELHLHLYKTKRKAE